MINPTKLQECHDRIRFTITDQEGPLRFTKFEIDDDSICKCIEDTLRSYLLNCPLADIDINAINHALSGGHSECAQAIEDIKKWYCSSKD